MKKLTAFLVLIAAMMFTIQAAMAEDIQTTAFNGDIPKLKELLGKNPDLIKSKDKDGFTALHLAVGAVKNGKETVEFLIAKGADINAGNNDGLTPLHIAATEGKPEIIKILIAKGANVNAKTKEVQNSALHLAAVGGKKEAVEALLAGGAKVNITNRNGLTPLDFAIDEKQEVIVKILQAKGGKKGKFKPSKEK